MLKRRIPLKPDLGVRTKRWLEDFVEDAASRKVQVSHTFGAVANAEERVRHTLGRRPSGFTVLDRSVSGNVYRDDAMTRKASRFFIYLKSSVAGLKVSLEIF